MFRPGTWLTLDPSGTRPSIGAQACLSPSECLVPLGSRLRKSDGLCKCALGIPCPHASAPVSPSLPRLPLQCIRPMVTPSRTCSQATTNSSVPTSVAPGTWLLPPGPVSTGIPHASYSHMYPNPQIGQRDSLCCNRYSILPTSVAPGIWLLPPGPVSTGTTPPPSSLVAAIMSSKPQFCSISCYFWSCFSCSQPVLLLSPLSLPHLPHRGYNMWPFIQTRHSSHNAVFCIGFTVAPTLTCDSHKHMPRLYRQRLRSVKTVLWSKSSLVHYL
jgi:hypothetical protein